jgi:hypothetical protein
VLFCFCLLAPVRAPGEVILSEFMASNAHSLVDEDGQASDWIELQNLGPESVNLLNWSLTDEAADLTKWRFPATNLNAGSFLVVFASGKNRRVPGAPLHTSFNLSAAGEYLALVQPDGRTIATEFAPAFPPQVGDVSFGFGVETTNFTLVSTSAALRAFVPADGALGDLWTLPGFADGAWLAGTNGVGFDTGVPDPAEDFFANAVTTAAPLLWLRLGETAGGVATNSGSLGAAASGSYLGGTALGQAGPRPPGFGGFEADNRAAQFNGTTARVQVPDHPAFDLGSGPFTIALWFNPANAATRGDLFTYKGVAADFGIHVASQTPNTVSVYHSGFIGTGGALVNNTWYFLVFTREASGRATAWLNGAVLFTGTDAQTMNIANDLLIGANHTGTPGTISIPFNGLIDEFALYSRALTTNEIVQQYQTAAAPGGGGYAPFIRTDLRAAMAGVNSSVYLRIPFLVEDVSQVDRLTLRLRYDDGFVAYLNGQLVVSANAADTNAWNAAATARHADAEALTFVEFNVDDGRSALVPGINLLAIQGLNVSAANPDFLIEAELQATGFGALSAEPRYFLQPSPGAVNGAGAKDLGPILAAVEMTPALPAQPTDNQDLVVTARVTPAFAPLTGVTLRWRVMFGVTNATPMFDDGAHGDGFAGDGIYGASIPASASTPGQMVRFYVTASDAAGRTSRWPLFEDPLGSPEYLGTVIANPVASGLPVWDWFAADLAAARANAGTRGAAFFKGRFYDNIRIRRRGAATTNGQKFDFLRGFRCEMSDELTDLDEVNINNEASDASFIRPSMAYETFRGAGNAAPLSFNLLLRANGVLDRVGIFVEQVDERFLLRNGRDPAGALYKFIQRGALTPIFTDPNDGVEKKTRLNEDRSDLAAVCAALALTNAPAGRLAFLMDNFDVPALMTHLACRSITMDSDDVRKNIYLYRDTLGNREWTIVPWDKDWTFGILGDGGIYLQNPFFGDQAHSKQNANQWSLLYQAVFNEPKLSAMYLRRLRTLMDQFLQPPGTPANSGYFEQRADSWFTSAASSFALFPALGTGPSNATYGASGSVRSFLPGRRTDLYVSFAATNQSAAVSNRLVPFFQLPNVTITLGDIEYNPASGNQAEEYVQLVNNNPFAVDISGWRLDGAIQHTFRAGTVMLASNVMFVSPDVTAFRARSSGPRGGQGLLVQGNYRGQLSARGETVLLYDDRGRLVHTNRYDGAPSLAQQFLRISEIMYHPSALAGNTNGPEEFEFIELKNISATATLSLAGVRFVSGIGFDFTGSGVTTLAPGATLLVVRNQAAFTARYGAIGGVAGQFTGALENRGERLRLVDASGEEILDFSYNNQWYPMTDGFGFSLVAVNEQAEPDAWDTRSNWRASAHLGGSPLVTDPAPPTIPPIRINEALTRSDVPPPTDTIELYNPTGAAVDVGGWYLTDDFNSPKKYQLPPGTVLAPGGYGLFDESQFTPGGTGFALGSDGDEVWLFSADAGGNLTGYVHGFRFGAAEDGVTFGRYLTSQGDEHFVSQRSRTLGSANSGPSIGPVVISEVHYHPVDLPDGRDNDGDEFVELLNVSSAAVALFDPVAPLHTWQARGGIEYAFPPGQSLAAGDFLLLVGFDPSTNASRTAAFRARFGLDPAVPLFGPWHGKLDNSSDEVGLFKPTTPLPAGVPYVLVDRVVYHDDGPWPAAADGGGASLQRISVDAYGDDPINWLAAVPTPGRPRVGTGVAPSIVVQPSGQTLIATTSGALSVSATGSDPLRYQWRRNGANLPGGTNFLLAIPNAQSTQAGEYSVLVYNQAGSTVSSNASVRVLYAAFILQQPAGLQLRGSTNSADYGFTTNNASFSVVAVGSGNLRYQWRFNGADLPGQTGTSLTVSNVDLARDGSYDVAITDDVGTVFSAPARLAVLLTPSFVVVPLDQAVVSNGSFSVSAVVRGNPAPFRFEWREVSAVRAAFTNNEPASFFTSAPVQNPNPTLWRLVVFNAAAASGVVAQFRVVPLADFDHDGIPDVYEQAIGLNTNDLNDAIGDLDHDGVKNREEYLAGTDPLDPASYLRVDETVTPGLATLRVQAQSNHTYTVQFNDALGAGSWRKLVDLVARPTNRLEFIPDSNWTSNRLYRVVVPAQP